MVELPGGYKLRLITPDDVESTCALIVDRMSEGDAADLRSVVATHPENVAVVVDDDRVVSTLTLLDEVVSLGAHGQRSDVPAGQIELVATYKAYEKRGFVRALVNWAHAESTRRGHLMQVMLGIPFYYRQFGYEYTTKMPVPRSLASVPPQHSHTTVRPACVDDVDSIVALNGVRQSSADVLMARRPATWLWVCDADAPARVHVAVRDDAIVGAARLRVSNGSVEVGELCGDIEPLLGYAATLGDAVVVYDVGDPDQSAQLDAWCGAGEVDDWNYSRIPDVPALLTAIAPALSDRLRHSTLAATSGCLKISWYRGAIEMDYRDGVFGELRAVPSFQGFVSAGGSYFPPDALGRLIFGVDSVASILDRFPDAIVRGQRELLDVVFPSARSDLATWYLPEG